MFIETGMASNLNVLNAAPKYTLYYNKKYKTYTEAN